MPKRVLFVQGGSQGAYAADSKLVANLEEKLGPDYAVRYPAMPNEDDPDYEAWKRLISKELASMGDDAILIGHSIGASVVIKMLAGDLKHSLAGVFLIATPFWHDHEVWRWKEVELPTDVAALIPTEIPVFLYHGRADETVPFSHLEMYVKAFPRAIVRRLENRNHQLNDDLREVAHDIRSLGTR
jgi:uncharacterized protein